MTLIPESLAKTSNVEDGEVDGATKPLRIGGQGGGLPRAAITLW